MDLDWAALGEELRSVRLQQGLTMEALAEKAGVSRMTIHKIEKGETRGRIPPSLHKIEEALGWPAGRAMTLLAGRAPSQAAGSKSDLSAELERSISFAAVATRGDLTAAEIQEMTRRVLADLQVRGLL